MNKLKLLILTFISAIVGIISFNFAFANEAAIKDKSSVTLDVEMNANEEKIRFIITSEGAKLEEIDTISLYLYKDGVIASKDIYITSVYTSIQNASQEYPEQEDTYYGLYTVDEVQYISSSEIEAYAVVAYTDSTYNQSETKSFVVPNNTIIKHYNYFEFGRYPQTKVEDTTLISSLNTLAGDLPTSDNLGLWTDYEYYISSEVTSYMYYIDIDYDSDGYNDYRGVYFTSYRPNVVSSASSADNSYQDDNGYEIGNVYWFSYDPIKWIIVNKSSGNYFLMADLLLDAQPFSVTDINQYNCSYVRSFLNEDFYDTAFTTYQKSMILTTTVDNSVTSTGYSGNSYACVDTNDKVFLLSRKEITTYYGSSSNERLAYTTDYAQSQSANTYADNNGTGEWWMRSASATSGKSDYVTRSGNIISSGTVHYKMDNHTAANSLRPCIIITPDTFLTNVSFNYESKALTLSNTGESVTPGTEYSVTATPKNGVTFLGWYDEDDNLVCPDETFTFDVERTDLVYTAKTSYNTVTTTVNDSTLGSVTSLDEAIYAVGDEVTVTATPNTGVTFLGFYINDKLVSTDLEYTYTMTAEDVTIEARFIAYTLTTTINDEEAGEITLLNAEPHVVGDEVTLTAELYDGYAFDGWYINNVLVSSSLSFTYVTTAENVVIEARFSYYTVTTSMILTNEGTYDYEYGTITTYDDYEVSPGDDVSVTATPKNGATFIGWYDDNDDLVTTNTNYEFTMGYSNVVLVAKFTHYTITTTTNDSLGGTYTEYDSERVKVGDTVSLTATINSSYSFVGWYKGDTLLSQSLTYDYEMTAEDVTIEARFIDVTVTAVLSIDGAGTITSPDAIVYNTELTYQTTINSGYIFLGWYNGSTLLTTDLSYQFTLTESITLTATYVVNQMTTSVNFEWGSVTSFPEYGTVGEYYDITATPNEGYSFAGWYKNGNKYSEDLTIRVQLEETATNYEANFTYYTVTLSTEDSVMGYPYPTITYNSMGGSDVEAQAVGDVSYPTPTKSGYAFAGWYTEEECVNMFDFESSLEENITLYAKWQEVSSDVSVISYNPETAYSVAAQDIDDQTYKGFYAIKTTTIQLHLVRPSHYSNVGSIHIYVYDSEFNQVSDTIVKYDENWNYYFNLDVEEGNMYYLKFYYGIVSSWPYNMYLYTTGLKLDVNLATIGSTKVSVGEDVSISACANTGYTFVGWYDADGYLVSTEATYEFVMTAKDYEFVARFSANTNTQYTVNYYVENVNNSDYTLYDSLVLTGTTGESTEATLPTLTGCTKPKLVQSIIAGDGSTVLNFYYTRNTHSVIIDANIAEALSVDVSSSYKFGQTISLTFLANAGYTFVSYTFDDTTYTKTTLETAMYDSDITITVTYSYNTDTNYTMSYYLMDADGEYQETPSYQTVLQGTTGTIIDESSIDIPDYYELEDFDAGLLVKGDGSQVVEVYLAREEYNVTISISDLTYASLDLEKNDVTYDQSLSCYQFASKYRYGQTLTIYFVITAGYNVTLTFDSDEVLSNVETPTQQITVLGDEYVMTVSANTNTEYNVSFYTQTNIDDFVENQTIAYSDTASLTLDYYGTTGQETTFDTTSFDDVLLNYAELAGYSVASVTNTTISGSDTSEVKVYLNVNKYSVTITTTTTDGVTLSNSVNSNVTTFDAYYNQTITIQAIMSNTSSFQFDGWYNITNGLYEYINAVNEYESNNITYYDYEFVMQSYDMEFVAKADVKVVAMIYIYSDTYGSYELTDDYSIFLKVGTEITDETLQEFTTNYNEYTISDCISYYIVDNIETTTSVAESNGTTYVKYYLTLES